MFTKNRDRLLEAGLAKEFLARVLGYHPTSSSTQTREGSVSRLLGKEMFVAAPRVTLLAEVTSSVRRGCKFVRIPSVATIWRVGVRNITLSERKYPAALLTTTLSLAVNGPMNRGRNIRMRNCIGLHDIEMLVGAKKPYVPAWHSDSSKLLALRELKE